MAVDWDEVFSYETGKVVRVKDKRLGALRLFFLTGISLYIGVYVLWYKQSYLNITTPVGNVRTTLMKEQTTTYPDRFPYCKGQYVGPDHYLDPQPCVVWDEYAINFPPDMLNAMMMCTRVTISTQTRQCQNQSLACVHPWSQGTSRSYYVAHIENATVMIEHSMTTPLYQASKNRLYAGSSRSLDGRLVDQQNNVLVPFPAGRDIVTVGNLLRAGGIDLGAQSDAEDDEGESMRYAGIVALVYIEYTNLANIHAPPTFTISVTRFTGAEHKTVQVLEHVDSDGDDAQVRTLYNRHGIKLVFLEGGTVAAFAFDVLLVQLVSALGLLSVATLVVEIAMLNLFPQRELYTKAKYVQTIEFSQATDNEVALENEHVVDVQSDLNALRYANFNLKPIASQEQAILNQKLLSVGSAGQRYGSSDAQ